MICEDAFVTLCSMLLKLRDQLGHCLEWRCSQEALYCGAVICLLHSRHEFEVNKNAEAKKTVEECERALAVLSQESQKCRRGRRRR